MFPPLLESVLLESDPSPGDLQLFNFPIGTSNSEVLGSGTNGLLSAFLSAFLSA
jgi:hypothetical protein